ncbi:hypothetical protein SBRY_60515 [Actinacidiphila bryophytorum]|uniref:Uncharacterized protein n=1 Tax=Actinacidiphila bryophytorum TaxID=1436133 RepID=A0A9W4H6P8_9ACTN|nr:hypothetical protein SBRY_60515 [Actinacidiphila bryophytorum]
MGVRLRQRLDGARRAGRPPPGRRAPSGLRQGRTDVHLPALPQRHRGRRGLLRRGLDAGGRGERAAARRPAPGAAGHRGQGGADPRRRGPARAVRQRGGRGDPGRRAAAVHLRRLRPVPQGAAARGRHVLLRRNLGAGRLGADAP